MREATCGCFGTIKVSPWYAFLVDVMAIVSLWFVRPDFGERELSSRSEWYNYKYQIVGLIAGSSAITLVVFGFGVWSFGSVEASLVRLRGDILTTEPGYVNFGQGTSGDVLEAAVHVKNWAETPVNLIGGTSDCTCDVTKCMPVSIPANGAEQVTIQLRVPRSDKGMMTRTVELYTNHDRQRTIRLFVVCRIR
jgi:hypothetical protein